MKNGCLHLEKIEVVLNYLQQSALATHCVQSITFTTTDNSYCYRRVRYQLPQRICFGYLPTVYGPPGSPTAPLAHIATFPSVTPI